MVRCTTLCMHMRLGGVESDGHMYYSLLLFSVSSLSRASCHVCLFCLCGSIGKVRLANGRMVQEIIHVRTGELVHLKCNILTVYT